MARINVNIDEIMKEIREEDAREKKLGRPRKGESLRVGFSGRVDPSTLATLMRANITPSMACEMIAKQIREKKSANPLAIAP